MAPTDMKPRSLSATALQTAEACLARYAAEHMHYGRGMGGGAASLGTACHGALEMIVQSVKIDGHVENWNLKFLEDMYKMSYMSSFGTGDTSGPVYNEGWALVKGWFMRTDLAGVTVLSVEKKDNFPVQTSEGPIPFNYVWDRFDELGNGEYKVVDYKTNKWGLNPDDLRKKIQARAYGLACAIQLKTMGLEYSRIWVEFDMLRHTPVGVVFSRDENVATWKYIQEAAERILATDPTRPPETLNPECLFCVRKQSCNALKKNISAGGVFGSFSTPSEAVDIRAALEWQAKGIAAAIRELDEVILTQAKEEDVLQYESDLHRMKIGVSARKSVDAERAEMILGPVLFKKYGKSSITVKDVEGLLKGDELTNDQRVQLQQAIYKNLGEPKVKVESKSPLGDD